MNLHCKYFASLILLMFPLVVFSQSLEELGAPDTLQAEVHNVGGDSEEDMDATALFSEASRDLHLWDVNDSIANIPAYDTYCHFDTRNIFLHKEARDYVVDTTNIQLCRESCDFAYPVAGPLNSDFGPRWGRMHLGIDIDLETGDEVKAAFEGMVRIAQNHPSYGNVVVIRHNNGLETLYAHLSKLGVQPGESLQAGDIIGLGGSTGRSTGPHLHFEVRYLGEAINPNAIVDVKEMRLKDWEFDLTAKHFDHPVVQNSGTNPVQKKYHTIKSGDSLSSIAVKHGTTITALCKLNKISRNGIIRAGQKLRYR
ncbi:MAG: M23 family metallopeptidase [Flavobacteriales bacterium]|nr:M23 family metallopeptidase [Flavobacteriales bacterium]